MKNEISFSDLFAIDDIQQLQDEFAIATGVASIITTPEGVPITKPSNFCRLCSEIIRNTDKGRSNCYKSDAIIGCPSLVGPTVQTCMSGGLWDAGAGITVEGRHIANWLIGQVRDETQTEEQMANYAKEINTDVNDFLDAYREVPAMSLERFRNIASMLYTLANQISSVAYQNVKQTQLINKLKKTESELKKNQEELLASEHRLSIVVDNLPDAMIYQVESTSDGRRNFTYISDNIRTLNEVTVDSVRADANVLYSQVHPDDLPALIKTEENAIKKMEMFRHEARFILPNGKIKWFQLTSSPRKIIDEVITWDGIQIDITDRKKAEEEQAKLEALLRQSQKIEAIGQLAGGVAHDLNNMLSPIIGYAELLLLESDQKKKNKKAINGIINAGFKARDLVQQLLAFGRKQTLDFVPADLNSVVLEFQELLRRTVREDIEITTQISDTSAPVRADIRQLEQVIMNLVVNAQDAMPLGGKLIIETSRVFLPQKDTHLEIVPSPGEYIKLSVRDTGCGIPENIRSQVFEPFFSTKGDKGTGLGLATVYGIITQHKGTVSIENTQGSSGTAISVYLPVSADKSPPQQIKKPKHSLLEGDETILLVEDNQQVLEMTESLLKQKGYTVLTAADGNQGIGIIHKYEGQIHLLLTDVVMPNLNGKDLYLKAKEVKQDLEVLYMSGYSDDVISHQGMLEEGTNFIQKPFSASALHIKIRDILDK
ncbi:PocR ligand-binding domain-containing protein [Desulfopila sp. IMCC35008]|uniref:PocR ligand-binding domain-containing protein n=1 Tax=Desulfopila sp. IMCC35008 TaxID=2653858 RepID=UPI0013D7F31E|nr:PocR ligand-binding domain-containing protein [Desulfopila sp. IMCC35008]